jgi:hypothetical protein
VGRIQDRKGFFVGVLASVRYHPILSENHKTKTAYPVFFDVDTILYFFAGGVF